MITIHSANATEFSTNGLAVLEPDSCILTVTLNGGWAVELEHPYDQDFKKYNYIQEDNILKIDNIPIIVEQQSEYQLFRIDKVSHTLNSVQAIAFPIALEARYDAIIEELKTEKQTATVTLVDIMAYLAQHGVTKYTIESDYSQSGVSVRQKKGNFVDTNLIEAISGSGDGSIINHWGGEVAYDNYKIIVNGKLGVNRGYDIRYGKNMTGLSVDVDTSGVVTRLYPKSNDGVRLSYTPSGASSAQSYVDSSHILDYPYVRSAYIDTDFKLVDTSFKVNTVNTESAIATNTFKTNLTNSIREVAFDMWNKITHGTEFNNKWYEPEWVQSVIDDVVKTLQSDLMNTWSITHPSLKTLVQTCIKDGISWIKKEDIADYTWDNTSGDWQYTNGDRILKSQYAFVDRRYCYFNASGNYEPWKDVDSMAWVQNKANNSKKKYGNNKRYYAKNTYVYLYSDDGEGNVPPTKKLCQFWFDSDGWWDGTNYESSEWDWHQTGDKWWFGASDAGDNENKYAHDCWLYIKATDESPSKLYYFDSDGYSVSSLETSSDWGWHEKENKWYFGSTTKSQNAVYLTSQWYKVDGAWRKFKDDGTLTDMNTLKTQITTLLKNAINTACASAVSTNTTALYTTLYEQMVTHCQDMFQYEQVDLPSETVQVDVVDLSKTLGYDITEEEPTPPGYWNCDDEWKTTGYTIAWEAPQWHDRYWKWNNGLACGCLGTYYSNGNLVNGFVSLSGNVDDCAMSSNGPGGTKATIFEVEIEGQTLYRSTDLATIYNLRVSEGNLPTLDFYSAHGRHARSFDEFFQYFLEVSHFTTKKRSLKGIHLGDDVKVIDYVHGFNIDERVVALKYDCIRGYNTAVTINKVEKTLTKMVGSSNNNGKFGKLEKGETLIAGEGIEISNGVIGVSFQPSGDAFQGSQVVVDPAITSGTKLADIYIDGTAHPIYGDGGTEYSAGSNIQISNHVISATDTKYTAGTNVQISQQNVISATDTTYNDFAGSTHGLVPAVGSGESSKYLRGDGSWAIPNDTTYTAGDNVQISNENVISATNTTYSDFDGSAHGLVPAPSSGDSGKYLKADGSWDTPTDTTYTAGDNVSITNNVISATDTTYGDFSGSTHGLVPSVSTQAGKYLKDDGSWDTPTDTTYSDFNGSAHGLVPAVGSGDSGFLKSDGTWATPTAGASALEDLTDVDITTPTEGQILKYDGSEWVNADSDTEIVTHLIEQGSSAWYKKHDDANTYVRLSSSSTIGEYWNFQSKSDFSSGDYHEEIVYKNAIPLSARRIRYKLEATNKNTNISDNYIVIGLKTTLDSTNYAYTSDTDFVFKESIFYDQETTIEGEIEIQPTSPLYLYVTTTGWTVNIYTLDVVEYSSGVPTLEELEDVNISNPSDGQVLSWDSQNNEWKNTNQSGGTTVIANPSGTATADLNKIQIGSDIYDIPSGGGGGGRTVTTLYTNTGTSAPNSIILSDAYTNYDELYIFGYRTNNTSYKATSIYMTEDININDKITVGDDALYAWYTVTNATTLTNAGANMTISKIKGIKY